MPLLFHDDRLEVIHARLLAHYGPPVERELWDPMTQCIYSMLSSRTKTEVSHEVLRGLRTRFGTWERLRDAPVAEIEETIRAATFPETKAINLKAMLEQITIRCGTLSLAFLSGFRTEKIRTWLEQFAGVGVKTSAAVVNFSTLRRRALCIDSHHLRIAQRLGLVPRQADARETEERLMEMAPAAWTAAVLDDHHSLVKLHGQVTCMKNGPLCSRCPLLDVCPTGLKGAYVDPGFGLAAAAELLAQIGLTFEVEVAEIDETPRLGEEASAYVARLAEHKAAAVMARHPQRTRLTVLGADTTVLCAGQILNKPMDEVDAARMLRLLSGRTHEVLTGVALVTAERHVVTVELTRVEFAPLNEGQIASYIASGEPMGKAGAYAIQGRAARFIPRIEGCYFNVVGLPLARVSAMLETIR